MSVKTVDIRESLAVLDLKEEVDLDTVKAAYRVLVKVWHPDRFEGDPELRESAEEKLKEINRAYDRIKRNPHLLGRKPDQFPDGDRK